jgi:hypothetical protein
MVHSWKSPARYALDELFSRFRLALHALKRCAVFLAAALVLFLRAPLVESSGKYLVNCFVDGVEKNFSDLKELEIESVKRLDFYVGEDIDILIASLLELDKYIDNVGNALFVSRTSSFT